MHRAWWVVSPVCRTSIALLAAALILAACGGTPSPSPSAAPTAAPSVAGPSAFADWTARQGFGGSSGVRMVNTLTAWLVDNSSQITVANLDGDVADIGHLVEWLDAHPATACWADYHAAMRASLVLIEDGYATARTAVVAGKLAPLDALTAIHAESQKALDMPAPAHCP